MAETLLFVSIGALLIVGAASLVIAALVLRDTRRSVELAESRVERLCEERDQLTQELKREREQHLEAQQRAEQLGRERLLLRREQGQLAKKFAQECQKHLEAQRQAEQLSQERL